ncbi:2-phosphosulfolactate phosphatase [Serratia rubidaea]|uniref:Probable 2-phosphosulfolactate phosphatase n=1 Tax=Serratia rubidaea TaxID=61652 RepID=A0A448SFT5_SERRU|nr:2-phosphosulfolactate phosphatase [Serratia rubidaea]MBH1932429.1 2-phosphosulfolactate phosphatase [Serratia rubidaea]MDC6117868.1 2-phosphosulfolactate phosphatase [Serratia rubidaea]MEB7585756.1 2-phosphosulfolactate phosphatase [Serratia rubidaea]VEI66575.1 Probable 2-phosphosulfolactate phosphatase [Serratia rubidaea]
MTWYTQEQFSVRLEWGIEAVEQLAEMADCIIIVDVMSFSTCISLALDNGAQVYPYPWKDESAIAYGNERGAHIASTERRLTGNGYSLSPSSLKNIEQGARLVLPSPNGSAISFRAKETAAAVFSGCFRNMAATARACHQFKRILVVPCGERWPNGTLRPAVEDLAAAGGIISYLTDRTWSPEASAAVSAYRHSYQKNISALNECASALELASRGFENDVALCLERNMSEIACRLHGDVFAPL